MELFYDFVSSGRPSFVSVVPREPVILFPRLLRQRTWHYTNLPTEFSWMGTVEEVGDLQFLITGFYPSPQEASTEHATLLREGNMDLLERLDAEGPQGEAKINALRLWAHSHHTYPVNPSADDDLTFENFRSLKHPWFIQGIFNRHSEVNFKMYLFSGAVIVENVRWVPVDDIDRATRDLALRDVEQNLKQVPSPVKKHSEEGVSK